MKTIFRLRGLGGLLFAQTQVAFNDNAIKLVLIGLVQLLLPQDQASAMVSMIALLLVAPFVLFAPITGWLADRFPHRDVLAGTLWLQLAVMGLLLTGTLTHSLPVAIGGFFLLGLQSALMGPARRGMVKDIAGERVGEAIGWMEMLCIAAILAGSLAGGQLIDGLAGALKNPWLAATAACAVLAVGCGAAIVAFRHAPRHPAASNQPFGAQVLFGHVRLLKTLHGHRSLWLAAVGDSAFYLAGGILMLTLAEAGRALHPDGLGAARSTGLMMALVGGGIAVGSVVAARLNRHSVNLGLVPVGAAGMAAALGGLAFLAPGGTAFSLTLLVLGIAGGLFIVPLGAFLVARAPDEERGQILAASSMLSSLTGVAAVGVHALATRVFGFALPGQFFLMAAILAVVAILSVRLVSQDLLRLAALFFARRHYRVTARGAEHLPATGGALIVCNHVSYVDTLALSLAARRPIRFLAYDGFFRTPVLGAILRIFGAIPVSSTRAKDSILRASEAIRRGELVCIFPEGQLTRTGSLMELKSGFELIARRAACPVYVAHLDGLWGSIFSFAGGRYFTKWPRQWRLAVTVSFSAALPTAEATASRVRELMLALGAESFARRPRPTLTASLVRALRRHPNRIAMVDGRPLRAGALLGVSLGLARRWRRLLPQRRVGVLLPPGLGGALANAGLLLAGRTPVNLNPTLSAEAARHCLESAGLEAVITAEAVLKKFPRFPWPERVLFIEHEIPVARPLGGLLRGFLLPVRWLAPARSEDEAVLLFTSGSNGRPKGVSLSHDQIMANLTQVAETDFLRSGDRLLTGLPLFHSFGLTMGLFLPLLKEKPIITVPSPLDSEKITEAARRECPTVLLSTPTFLRGYLKRVPADALLSLRITVTGAEPLPEEVARAFRAKYHSEVVEGYGLTEAAPVVALNAPNPAQGLGAESVQIGARPGSVGRLLPGLAARFHDPETGLPEPGATSGLLALRGANLARAYLGGEEPEKFADGWFLTGDVARLDAEGFLFIEGRLSRFSKIGGEMVSHTAVEQALARCLPPGEGADCVLGRPCPEKGEQLVLLTTRDVERETLRRALVAAGVPNLWIPRHVLRVDALPSLGSGKLDLASCRRLADTSPVTA